MHITETSVNSNGDFAYLWTTFFRFANINSPVDSQIVVWGGNSMHTTFQEIIEINNAVNKRKILGLALTWLQCVFVQLCNSFPNWSYILNSLCSRFNVAEYLIFNSISITLCRKGNKSFSISPGVSTHNTMQWFQRDFYRRTPSKHPEIVWQRRWLLSQ